MLDGNDFAIEIEFLVYAVLELANTTEDVVLSKGLREIARDTLALIAPPLQQPLPCGDTSPA
jgi:hypothetical protein